MATNPELLRRARVEARTTDQALWRDLLSLSALVLASAAPRACVQALQGDAETLTAAEFAAAAGVEADTVRRACREGRIDAIKRVRDWRIPVAELVRWQASR